MKQQDVVKYKKNIIESKKRDKVKSTGKKKIHSVKDNRNSAFRNNYKHYQYDYEEDFYEPY